MNEQIRKLSEQALDKSVPHTWTTLDYEQIHKLLECHAKLVAEECASLFPMVFTDQQYQRRIDKTIRKHFEIE